MPWTVNFSPYPRISALDFSPCILFTLCIFHPAYFFPLYLGLNIFHPTLEFPPWIFVVVVVVTINVVVVVVAVAVVAVVVAVVVVVIVVVGSC